MIWVALWLGLNVAVALAPTVTAWLRERRRLAQERDAVWAMRQKALLLTREEWEAEQRVLASPFLGDCDEIVRPMSCNDAEAVERFLATLGPIYPDIGPDVGVDPY